MNNTAYAKTFVDPDAWIDRFAGSMSTRFPTTRLAMNLVDGLGHPPHMVETGCIRMLDDWGAGYSTYLWGRFCQERSGSIITIDYSAANMEVCKRATAAFSDVITYVVEDSLTALAKLDKKIDLLYLDSMDVPLAGEYDIKICQEHNLKEMLLAEPLLHEKSVVLIDDHMSNGGKGLLTRDYLISRGWTLIYALQQLVFIKR